ncbi:PTS IIA-like nitrogen regulatory protein PtsN [Paralimibaculum aggregatum]|uniref:PTS IIA-like nitrogen regulatory protein PtsN n=1 Tax=Paralimibaculum aggregatum TaxID=3036245 RepID=A0ABQ6LSA4_9RHOB|nr:PTS IIA-like nitrogen regulatory protein PtsN [Limibaculum sp. NKW23]GMG84891.1 PTS IIA-like nitrogen regulatory protein PtsN [Limibaculum sp. NKW23]
MELADLVAKSAILPSLKVSSKKQLFQEIANRAADAYKLKPRDVIAGLTAREQLGSTAMGDGVAIPHARIAGLDHIVGLFARLDRPVDFDAMDGRGVDLVFVLLAPEESGADHLRALARVSRLLRSGEVCEKLRETAKGEALYALITEPMASRAA